MKLVSARIQNFRSIEDSGTMTVDQLTCLVGKNEAGKTAVLQAIAGLNPHPATPFDYQLERDYPKRFLARYKERHPDENARIISSEWSISDRDKEVIESEFGPDALTGNEITLSRTYNSKNARWSLPINVSNSIAFIIDQSGFSAPEKSQVGTHATTESLIAKLNELAADGNKYRALLDKIN